MTAEIGRLSPDGRKPSARDRRGKVTVVGSYAVGLTIRVDHYPVAGETRIGSDFDRGPGGKGSNQAIQAARLGADVQFVGVVGDDVFGDEAVRLFEREGVGTRFLARSHERPTGVGFIVIDSAGQNRIVVYPGANELLKPGSLDSVLDRFRESAVVAGQFEIPVSTALTAMRLAHNAGCKTILNPAPAVALNLDQASGIDVVTPNETELRILTGRSPESAADLRSMCGELLASGVETVVLTRGELGALIVTADGTLDIPAPSVDVVDTTGAGDAFNGTLAVGLAQQLTLENAVRRAVIAGACACQRIGVVPSLPDLVMLEMAFPSVAPS